MKRSRTALVGLTLAVGAALGALGATPAGANTASQPPVEGVVGPGEAFVGGVLKIAGVGGPGAAE